MYYKLKLIIYSGLKHCSIFLSIMFEQMSLFKLLYIKSFPLKLYSKHLWLSNSLFVTFFFKYFRLGICITLPKNKRF